MKAGVSTIVDILSLGINIKTKLYLNNFVNKLIDINTRAEKIFNFLSIIKIC
jgi:hypothetical protein